MNSIFRFSAVAFLSFLLCSPATARYGAYDFYPTGSRRIISLGGAYAGLADSVAASGINPAGMVFGNWNFVAETEFSRLKNKEADLDDDGILEGNRIENWNSSGAINLGAIAFGFALSEPYATEVDIKSKAPPPNQDEVETRIVGLNIQSNDFPVSVRVSKKFAVGFTIHSLKINQDYNFSSTSSADEDINLNTTKSALGLTLGIAWRSNPKNQKGWGWGISHKFRNTFSVDQDSLNTKTKSAESYFRNMIIPARSKIGFHLRAGKRLLLLADLEVVEKFDGGVFPGSELNPQISRVEIREKGHLIFRTGMEWHMIGAKGSKKRNFLDSFLRMGFYTDPGKLVGELPVNHFTAGIDFRVWALTFAATMDTGDDFLNLLAGVRLNIPIM